MQELAEVPGHEPLPDREGEFGVHRIQIAGIEVRMVEDMHLIQVTVAGSLPTDTSRELRRHLAETLARLENTPVRIDDIAS